VDVGHNNTLNQARAGLATTSLGNLAFFGGGYDRNQASNLLISSTQHHKHGTT
jgi:hypothetical protein